MNHSLCILGRKEKRRQRRTGSSSIANTGWSCRRMASYAHIAKEENEQLTIHTCKDIFYSIGKKSPQYARKKWLPDLPGPRNVEHMSGRWEQHCYYSIKIHRLDGDRRARPRQSPVEQVSCDPGGGGGARGRWSEVPEEHEPWRLP